MTCDSNCTNSHQNPLLTSGVYVFESWLAPANVSSPSFHQFENSGVDSGTAFIFVNQYFPYGFASFLGHTHCSLTPSPGILASRRTRRSFPPGGVLDTGGPGWRACATQTPTRDQARRIGGPNTLYSYAHTFQNVVNNSLTLAHAHFDAALAVTNHSELSFGGLHYPAAHGRLPAGTDRMELRPGRERHDRALRRLPGLRGPAFNSTFSLRGAGSVATRTSPSAVHWNTTFRPYLNITASVYLGYGHRGR